MGSEKRGCISFFSTYRPPVALELFSCVVPPKSKLDEVVLTDGKSYNYNGRVIPPEALDIIKKLTECKGGRSGMVFVSERTGGLETLHVALYSEENLKGELLEVVSSEHLSPNLFYGVRMEDSGCFAAGKCFVYVSTKQPAAKRRQPWTAVYSTNLETQKTQRLTPPGVADLSPSVSPSKNTVAVASFQGKTDGWDGEIEDLQTNIYVMDVNNPSNRKLVVKNGGWPTWGSDNVLFFHRKVGDYWGVFQVDDVSNASPHHDTSTRVTPEGISAMTPAAIDATTVAVATIRQKSNFGDVRVEDQYRHIEIFDSTGSTNTKITQKIRPLADHFNPFVIDGGKRIGYHCAKSVLLMGDEEVPSSNIDKIVSPYSDVGLFRLPGPFPTFKKDTSIFAYVDNEFKAVWLADIDSKKLRIIFDGGYADKVWSPVWNKNPFKDTLYVCMGPSYQEQKQVDICAFTKVSEYLDMDDIDSRPRVQPLIVNGYNNAFPSTNPDGTKLVFRSNVNGVNGGQKKYMNLYIMEDAQSPNSKITRLTEGEWTDTHCQWSPSGDWIVFSSSRGKPDGAAESDNACLDDGYFAVFLLNWNCPSVVVRVMASGSNIAGHVNHPFFSPDLASIVVSSDFAAVSVEPISLPLFVDSVRTYGDIFTIDIDPHNILNNKDRDVKYITRSTHSRYENSTVTWAKFPNKVMNLEGIFMNLSKKYSFSPACPYIQSNGGESWHMTGQLLLPLPERKS